ncbi:hypothetical protein B0H14DRAFT_3530969 [Mycena olivaceomarginata]|nr:hypothetical protein B0H14DRAFT_3530969 [Mycena olivaceomarginata]
MVDALPREDPSDPINKLLAFELDSEWTTSIGEEGSVNRSIENAIWGFGTRDSDSIFKITTRGPALEALADVLQYWLDKYPTSEALNRWLKNATDSAAAVISHHNEPLPSLPHKRDDTQPTLGITLKLSGTKRKGTEAETEEQDAPPVKAYDLESDFFTGLEVDASIAEGGNPAG